MVTATAYGGHEMSESQRRIREMLAERKITPDEACRRLEEMLNALSDLLAAGPDWRLPR